nr:homeobox-leucine zipper protein hat1 [Quercus suber]
MEYLDFSGHAGFSDHYNPHANPTLEDMHNSSYYNPNMNAALSCDIKPRLTKEQHDILETHFQEQNKPNTNIKKAFAESLGVSLERVNNWFQNRRAKSKQDAKKQQGAINLFQPRQDGSGHVEWDSSTEVSPAFSSTEYASMMQQCGPNDTVPDSLPRSISMSQPRQVDMGAGVPYHSFSSGNPTGSYATCGLPQTQYDFYDSPQELNRRTLTQDQFDAIAQNGNLMQGYDNYDLFHPGLGSGADLSTDDFLQQNGAVKQPSTFSNPLAMTNVLPAHDSTGFPASSANSFSTMSHLHERASMSVSASEWSDSRSSSVTGIQPAVSSESTNSQWTPGQSVEVDFKALNEQFQQVAQARLASQEQPLAFPTDEAFAQRDPQATLLAHDMSHIGIDTPQTHPNGVFKGPVPPSSIAARRQRPRPAALGLASLRSQSYSGATQPNSPSHAPQTNVASGQSLRRIRSSNVVGGVSQGRVQKVAGPAQRSPMNWNFPESLNSPKALRHASQAADGTLAPPTPMSPQFPRPEPTRSANPWQTSAAGQASRQPSISEHDTEREESYAPHTSVLPPQKFCSPPHTPMYYQQQFYPQHMSNNFHLENTPPQSAPPSQQCFAMNYPGSTVTQSQAALQQQPVGYAPAQTQQAISAMTPEQQFPLSNVAYGPVQPFNVAIPTVPEDVTMRYPYGVPIINANGQMQMGFPPQLQLLQQHQGSQMTSISQAQFPHLHAPGSSPETRNTRKPAPEFEVHEYTPSDALKRGAGPHKAVDTGPKNYTFANQGPEHFDKGKKPSETNSSSTTDDLNR